jgi:hypothetical protein
MRARPEHVWPWLVQIGFNRAGWYSYDLLDNLGRRSAERIIPELQAISVGDWVPMFRKLLLNLRRRAERLATGKGG